MDGRAAEPIEEVGESSSPPRGAGGQGAYDIKNEIYERLLESENEEVRSNPYFKEQFDAHFSRLPPSYKLDLNVDRADDVLIHQKVLAEAKDPDKRPVFHVRFQKRNKMWTRQRTVRTLKMNLSLEILFLQAIQLKFCSSRTLTGL